MDESAAGRHLGATAAFWQRQHLFPVSRRSQGSEDPILRRYTSKDPAHDEDLDTAVRADMDRIGALIWHVQESFDRMWEATKKPYDRSVVRQTPPQPATDQREN